MTRYGVRHGFILVFELFYPFYYTYDLIDGLDNRQYMIIVFISRLNIHYQYDLPKNIWSRFISFLYKIIYSLIFLHIMNKKILTKKINSQ